MAEQTAKLDEALRAEIKDIVCGLLRADPDTVTLTSRFVEDHGADSLQFVDMLASVERVCGVLVPPEEMSRMTTLGGVYSVLEQVLDCTPPGDDLRTSRTSRPAG
ncbi:acyl carrier protein [Streptomyces odontomachi]|uniref:acyl carrier protein n=1 Tax=Streptomyces odontomachi TaxID=2944940 RepID=UPI00210A0ED4|nr:acyl carrier protein [Streptomyces sp. ODS25]